jgi:hypothetical protein
MSVPACMVDEANVKTGSDLQFHELYRGCEGRGPSVTVFSISPRVLYQADRTGFQCGCASV